MEQFMKLPPAQKAAVLAAALAVVGVGLYFLLVDPEVARGDNSRLDLAKIEVEIKGLRDLAPPEEQERLRKLKDELIEADKENRKMLPTADEIPNFIETVHKDATRVGLHVRRFDRLPGETQDYYDSVPVKIDLEGPMRNVIQFMQTYAGSERRVINVRELAIEQAKQDEAELRQKLAASKPLDDKEKAAARTKTPDEVLLESIELAEIAKANAKVRATFTAYAFTWTGKVGEKKEGDSVAKKAKRKRT
jgi:Tfp pilus assembly protein PilO